MTLGRMHGSDIDTPIRWAPSLAFLNLAIAFTAVGAVAYLIVLLALVPEQTTRATFVIILLLLTALSSGLLRRGHVRTARWALAIGVWAYITVGAVFFGGVEGTPIIIYPIVILAVGWLIGARAAMAFAILASAATLAFVVGEWYGWIPQPIPTPPAMRWVIQCTVFILTAVLITHVVGSYRRQLDDIRVLGRELNRAQAVAHVGSWVYDLSADRILLSPETCRIFGLPEGAVGNRDSYLSRVHEADRAAVVRTWSAALAGSLTFDHEHRIYTARGTRWVRQVAEFERGPDGAPLRGVGTTQDITEHKRYDMEILAGRAQLQATLDAIPDLLFEVDLTGRFLDRRAPRTDMMATPSGPSGEFVGRTIGTVLPPEAAAVALAALREAHATGRSHGRQYELHLPQGRRWFELSVSRKPAAPGHLPRFIVLARDITDRKAAEEELRERDDRLSAVFQASPLPIIVSRVADGAILDVNDAAARLYGSPREEIIGRTVAALQLYPRPGQHDELVRHLCDEGSVERFPIELRPRTDEARAMEAFGRIIELDGAPCSVTMLMDVTERKRLEDAHLQAQNLESLGTLAGGIAHDFNNILAAIRGNVELAAGHVGPAHGAANSLSEILKATSRASELVRRIMLFGRPKEVRQEAVHLTAVVEEVLQLLRSTLSANITLRTECADDMPRVIADAGQVHEVIVNLTTNAAHAIGSRAGSVTYRLEPVVVSEREARATPGLEAGRYVRLVVTDTGSGMDAAKLERIFDAFYTTKPVGEGTGLGLSIVRGIMKSHGGAVTADSTPGQGTRFTLFFREATTAAAADASVPLVTEGRAGRGRRVLFIDDEEALVLIASQMFELMGHEASCFTDPRAALEHFQSRPDDFDIVVTDFSMPGISGIELARAVLVLRPEMPVVLTTGWALEQDEEAARSAGVRELIPKPVCMDELNQLIIRLSEPGSGGGGRWDPDSRAGPE